MESNESVSRLLRLKRYEQPPPGYFEEFLSEFQCRQRAEVIQRPLWAITWDRIARFFAPPTFPRLAMGASFAAVILGATLMLVPETRLQPTSTGEQSPFSLAGVAPSLPAATESLRPEKPMSSVQYVLPAHPVGYASSRSF